MNTKSSKTEITAKKASALALVLGGGAGVAILMQGLLSFALPTQAQTSLDVPEQVSATKVQDPFEGISLEAHAVYVFDLKEKSVLFARNENQKLPLASVTKLMTALLAREHFSQSAVVTLTSDDLAIEGDSGLRGGERWRLGDILNVMLLVSSNDAAHAVASFVGADGHEEGVAIAGSNRENFVKMMNDKALALGLDQMQFFNESGLDVSSAEGLPALPVQAGGYGSAKNVAELFAELWGKYPETVEITAHKDARIYSQDNIAHVLPNTNEIVGHIPGLIASKTGFTDTSGGNLAIIFDRGVGDPVVAVVLGSSYKGRFDDMQKLVSAALGDVNPKGN